MTNDKKTNENSLTPLANKKAFLEKHKTIFMIGLLIFIFLGLVLIIKNFSEKKEEIKPVNNNQEDNKNLIFKAPKLMKTQPPEIATQETTTKTQVIDDREKAELEDAEKLDKMRMLAQTMVNVGNTSTSNNPSNNQNNVLLGGKTGDINSQFQSQVSSSQVQTSQATRIAHPEFMLLQGTMIFATLEPRIDSDLPTMLRAVTSEDIYSEDFSQVLLPKGSRLIGQYTNAISQGQERIFVVWQRAIRPDHIDIQLGSTGTDALGAAGIGADSVDTHFFERFGQSILLSIIGAGASTSGVNSDTQFNSASAYREAIANSFADSAKQSLKKNSDIQTTLRVNQGKKISVYVSQDLDFYSALKNKSMKSERNY